MTTSQKLVIAGGALMIVGTFAPIIVMDVGAAHPSAGISMLGSTPAPQRYHRYPHEMGIDIPTVLTIAGGVILLYAALAILFTTWWATARHLLIPALILDAVLIGGLVAVASMASDGAENIAAGWGWAPLIVGNVMIIVAAFMDRKLHAKTTTTSVV